MRLHNSSRRSIENIAYFRNKTINYDKKVRDFYIEDGIAYVSCNIDGYYDVIDHYSVKGYEWLNSDFTRFVEENCNNIPTQYPILLEICGGDLTEEQQQTIEETIKKYYQLKLGNMQEEYDSTKKRAVMLLCLAAVFFCVDALAHHIMNVSAQTAFIQAFGDAIQVLFWFLLWSDGDVFMFQLTDAKWERTYAAQISSIQIMFRKRFRDVPVAEEIREEIFENVFNDSAIEKPAE